MSIPARYDITHYAGDTYDLVVKIPQDLTLATIKFEIKLPDAANPTLELFEGSGIGQDAYDVSSGTTTIYINITATQSTNLGTSVYYYDLETNTTGQVTTWLSGTYAQMAQVTQ